MRISQVSERLDSALRVWIDEREETVERRVRWGRARRRGTGREGGLDRDYVELHPAMIRQWCQSRLPGPRRELCVRSTRLCADSELSASAWAGSRGELRGLRRRLSLPSSVRSSCSLNGTSSRLVTPVCRARRETTLSRSPRRRPPPPICPHPSTRPSRASRPTKVHLQCPRVHPPHLRLTDTFPPSADVRGVLILARSSGIVLRASGALFAPPATPLVPTAARMASTPTAAAGDTSGVNLADVSAVVNGDGAGPGGEGEETGAAVSEVARRYAEAARRIVEAVGGEVRGVGEDGVSSTCAAAEVAQRWWLTWV